jgi:hypothetical protein
MVPIRNFFQAHGATRRAPQKPKLRAATVQSFSYCETFAEVTSDLKMTCDEEISSEMKKNNTSKRSATSCPLDDLNIKKAKIEVTLAASEKGQMNQIESEFQILKSLIPNIAERKQINEVNYKFCFTIF